MTTSNTQTLLAFYHDDVVLTAWDELVVHDFIFSNTDLPGVVFPGPVFDTITYLRELAADTGCTTASQLISYITNRQKRVGQFLWEITAPEEEPIDLADEYEIPPVNPIDLVVATGTVLDNNFSRWGTLVYPNPKSIDFAVIFQKFLRTWAVHYKTDFNKSIREKNYFSIQYLVDPTPGEVWNGSDAEPSCQFLNDRILHYAKRFVGHNAVDHLYAWQTVPQPVDCISSWSVRRLETLPKSRSADARISKAYELVLYYLKHEQPIVDRAIKEEMLHWLCYLKVYRQVFCEQKGMMDIIAHSTTNSFHRRRQLLKAGQQFKDSFGWRSWTVLKSPDGLSWLTSDNPGFSINLADFFSNPGNVMGDTSLTDTRSDTLVYYPISNDYCLRIQPPLEADDREVLLSSDVIDFKPSSLEEFDIVNRLTVATSANMVFSKDQQAMAQLEMI